jgi:hypothetical protein
MEKNYPIGGYAPGNYYCTCATCKAQFQGDKMAVQCEPCAVSAKERFDKLDPNEQDLLIKRNARIANFMFSGPLSPERELIYRIVEQWGNAIEMPKMEGWLKEYAKGASAGAVWVKASEQLPGLSMRVKWRSLDDEWFGLTSTFLMEMSITALEKYEWLDESAAQDDWISVDERLPEISEYVMVHNIEGATLVGRLMSNGWVAMFADGEKLMGNLTATHWRPLPSPPKPKK